MLTITIKPINPELFDLYQMDNIAKGLLMELKTRRFLFGLMERSHIDLNEAVMEITYFGITSSPNNEDRSAVINYMAREFSAILNDIGLNEVCFLSGISTRVENGDKVITTSEFKPTITRNGLLLSEHVKDEEIPEEYLCNMSQQLIDEAVHITTRPDVKYNAAHLRYWLFTQNYPQDPLSRVAIDPVRDVIVDVDLNNKIREYVNKNLREGLEKRKQKFLDIMKHYQQTTITQAALEKAFRRAAAENNTENLNELMRKTHNINAQDDNPLSRKTAMHWAVKNGALNTIKLLLQKKAKTDIVDATGKTAIDYAKGSSSNEVKMLLLGVNEQLPQSFSQVRLY